MAKLCKREDYTRPKPDMTPPPGGVWYAVVANVNCEHKAELGLSAVCHTYLPVAATLENRGGRRKTPHVVEKPLFPRYLFVASRRKGMFPFFTLRGVQGVESIVRSDGEPLPIPHGVIAAIMERDAAGEFDKTQPKRRRTLEDIGMAPGQLVRIKGEGSFAGIEGTVRKLMRGTHAAVFLNLFGRETQTEIPVDELEKVA